HHPSFQKPLEETDGWKRDEEEHPAHTRDREAAGADGGDHGDDDECQEPDDVHVSSAAPGLGGLEGGAPLKGEEVIGREVVFDLHRVVAPFPIAARTPATDHSAMSLACMPCARCAAVACVLEVTLLISTRDPGRFQLGMAALTAAATVGQAWCLLGRRSPFR